MFLRHIQLIFSLQVKTLKTRKCFVARNNFSDKLACCFLHVLAQNAPHWMLPEAQTLWPALAWKRAL